MSTPAATPASIKETLASEKQAVEQWLSACLTDTAIPDGLRAAMMYSLMAGGKRIRPVLCLLCARIFGTDSTMIMPFAGAIECIHTYSLIHDDLPAMDNDDLRRGKPSCHKQFTEATAILAGDGLLTDAFAYMSSVPLPAERLLAAIREVALAAGSPGMVGGQFLDMAYTALPSVTLEQIAHMHSMKTGAIITASCVSGALLGGATQEDIHAIRTYGMNLGAAFQITDDILDVTGTEEELGKPVGSDEEQNKHTYPSLLGLAKSQLLAEEKIQRAQQALAQFSHPAAETLRGIADYIGKRIS